MSVKRKMWRVGMSEDGRITYTYTPTRRDGKPYKHPPKPVTEVLMIHVVGDHFENVDHATEEDLERFGFVRAKEAPADATDASAEKDAVGALGGAAPANATRFRRIVVPRRGGGWEERDYPVGAPLPPGAFDPFTATTFDPSA